ncbi:MarR family winged helix-turn-helix transcriptional regulator [Agromyces larvae]|uniref:MarR family winged helix-turn-helix transcriptional regulator n=1 Tax=Agromyces larvae TaxID=2929802 RepID=A0ABY4C0M7_9MICO|nr:MarR family winged helix-turn-helix transcriptional regulator [Agromyces larvae]UOE43982.1 MarR family winged helix-turn-helix transcriptional regulator [Agromyces larvae]
MTAEAALDHAIASVEEQFGLVFNRARTLWFESAKQVHPELQPAGYKLLSSIVRAGSTNAHVLAELLDMDKSAVSRQVRQLEEMGLVESHADERDGRARVLVATPLAEERVAEVRLANQARLRSTLEGRSVDELLVLADVLRALGQA